MTRLRAWLVPVLGFVIVPAVFAAELLPLAGFQQRAAAQKIILGAPTFSHTPADLQRVTEEVLQTADARLAAIAALPPGELTFAKTMGALDALVAEVSLQSMMLETQREANVEATMREKAGALYDQVQNWSIALDYRDDVYQVIKRLDETRPKLQKDERRLLDEKLRDYRRAGLALPPAERREVERLRKELTEVCSEFSRNINQARGPVDFTAEELAGLPASFLESPGLKQPDGTYRALANVTWQALAISENATNPETRKRFFLVRNSLAKDTNTPVLAKMVNLRADIARRLGYATWGDYQMEPRMAKNAATAVKFEEDLVTSLQSKFQAELATLQLLKSAETGHANATIEPWDQSYYINQLKKQKYAIDAEQLRVFFPYEATLTGMFRIYERIFGLLFTEVAPPDGWAAGLKLFAVNDAKTSAPIGLFYLDMFPREGKFNHFACFPLRLGRFLPDGQFEAPVVSLICNFPPPSAEKPSLLAHSDVVTLFHEFGHVMHALLSRSRFVAQASFNVPQDFVEAPSQMLENWVWDKGVLDTFAADYRDSSKKIPAETIAALTQARLATEGLTNRRQLSFGLVDLALHAPAGGKPPADVVAATNAVLSRITLPVPPGTSFATYFGHLDGYGAAYYGYLWSKVIALDLASEFQAAPGGFLDEKTGRRLRDEVYGVGNTRDVEESVERFLGRKTNSKAFLQYIGIP